MSEEYRKKLRELKSKLHAAQKEYDVHLKTCDHNITKGQYGGAECTECEKSFGWWCPNSHDHVCHYPNEIKPLKGRIKLINGVDSNMDLSGYGRELVEVNNDNCIFCGGEPQERKQPI